MFSRILVSGLFAGALGGFIAGVLQWLFVQPVLLHSELYEMGILKHFGALTNSAQPDLNRLQPIRDILSILFSMVIYIGYAILLISAMTIHKLKSKTIISFHQGIIWGISGYIIVHFAPAISLPPEVPGVAAADLQSRQIWWFITIFFSAAGIWLIAFNSKKLPLLIGCILVLAPHIFGAPEPSSFTGPAPTEIGALFASRALGIGLISWAVLGGLSAIFLHKETMRATN